MRQPSGRVVLLALLVALVVLTLVGSQRGDDGPTLSVRSAAPAGARALALWLGDLGYRVEELDRSPCRMAEGVDLLLILQPTSEIDRRAVDCLATWVEAGGHLVLAVEIPLRPGDSVPQRLLDRFGYRLRARDTQQTEAVLIQPVLLRPPVERVVVNAWQELRGEGDWVPWLGAAGRAYAGTRVVERGRVTILAATHPLTNRGLPQADNAALALHLLGGAPRGARVAFDEYHHGLSAEPAEGLWPLLTSTYWGWAVLYAAVLVYAYLILSGRRFGHALAPVVRARRSLTEYVASLAALYRRAGQRGYVADRLADGIKRELGTALGLPFGLSDEAFAAAVGQRRGVDGAPLRAVLARLRGGQALGEADLLAAAREADALKARLLRRAG